MGSGLDFSGILTGIDGQTAVTAIIAAAAILALVGFAKWGAKKVGLFFDGIRVDRAVANDDAWLKQNYPEMYEAEQRSYARNAQGR